MNHFLDDKIRFTTFLKFFPEKFINDLVCSYLWNARYPVEVQMVLFKYDEYKNEIMSEFSNNNIEDSRIELDKSFDMLNKFLIEHFSIPNCHYKMYKNPPYFYLNPHIHHNFGGENKNPVLWNKSKKELDKVAEEFHEAYKSFIKIAKDEIEREKNMQDKKENINIEHPQKNTRNNKLADTIYNNGSLQINSGNNKDNNITTNTTDEKNKPKWWEKTWVQILMFLGAVAGIVGIVF